jgi:hypothetical protein
MPGQERRYPSIDEVIEKAKRGIIDERASAAPPFDLEDWEILGEPPPEESTDKRRRASA